MIDMVFLLLIFFLLTANFLRNEGIPINLPEAKTSTISHANHNLIVFVNAQGHIFLNNHQINLVSLYPRLCDLASKIHPSLMVKADKKAPVEVVIKIMDRARLAGITQIILATQQED